jgi:hypothetical protein
MQVTLTLVASLLLGTGPGVPTEPATKAQKDVENATVVILENATITISPETKFSIHPVKTEQGKRVRVEMPGVVIEAVRLRVKSKGSIFEIYVNAGGEFHLDHLPDQLPEGEIGGPAKSAAPIPATEKKPKASLR